MNSKKALKTVGDWISKETHKRKYDTLELAEVSQALIYLKKNTEQLNSNWIPVSERLPNEAGTCLVFNNMDIARKLNIGDYHSEVEIMYFSLKHKRFNTDSIVIAWQPLPEPWKGDK